MANDNNLDKRIAEVWAAFAEIAARQAKTDAQLAETGKLLKELRLQKAETDAQMAKTDAQMAETDKRLNKLMLGNESMQSFIKNDADACEQRFVDSLDSQNLEVAGVKFDEIYANVSKKRGGENIELDALLVNGDSVAIMEVKKKLHLNDVDKVHDKLIGRFRELFPEHRAKRLLVLVAGETVNSDAAAQALENGFIVLSFEERKLTIRVQQARYY